MKLKNAAIAIIVFPTRKPVDSPAERAVESLEKRFRNLEIISGRLLSTDKAKIRPKKLSSSPEIFLNFFRAFFLEKALHSWLRLQVLKSGLQLHLVPVFPGSKAGEEGQSGSSLNKGT